ncbi:glutathione S-transferase family protein [Shinella oryzae]|uniref:glutathione transferase n=1 Tax=Shinella oryzae TaxID=2871820 RepID=A0ABY9K662_9HYPH|nr:glutathione S-transferase family protein [Shinella oryzae]WLS02211.1 glutathione S-transferase family protein [Shinella oryzae]
MSDIDNSVFVYGAGYSVYVRIVRIVLAEKDVSYELVPVDVFAQEGLPAEYLARHPFGRIPAFSHGGFDLYETTAITRYIDESFDGPALQPQATRERARMNQIIAMLDNYAYGPMVWDVYVQRVEPPEGQRPDEAKIADGLEKARRFLTALTDPVGDRPWLAGDTPSLADFHAAPIFDLFQQAPEGAAMLAEFPSLVAWWERINVRPSVVAALA